MAEAEVTFVDDDPERFTVADNALIEDPNLTPQASFWLIYLKSRPKGWRVRVTHLATVKAVGRTAVETALQDLIEAGYMRRDVHRDDKGRIAGTTYTFSWAPRWAADPSRFGIRAALSARKARSEQAAPQPDHPEPGFPVSGDPGSVQPVVENPRLISTEEEQVLSRATTEGTVAVESDGDQRLLLDAPPATPPKGAPRCEADRMFDAVRAAFDNVDSDANVAKTRTVLMAAGWSPEQMPALAGVLTMRAGGRSATNARKHATDDAVRRETATVAPYWATAVEVAAAARRGYEAGRISHIGCHDDVKTAAIVAELLAGGAPQAAIKQAMVEQTSWTAESLRVAIDHQSRPRRGGSLNPSDEEIAAAFARRRAEKEAYAAKQAASNGNVLLFERAALAPPPEHDQREARP